MLKLYSSHCPKCNMIQNILQTKNIPYELIDNENVYIKIANENNIENMPFAEIDGVIYNTKDLQKWILNK